jgi:hypothetical protein
MVSSLRLEEENGHVDAVLYSASCSAKKYVGEEPVPMCAHGHQLATLLLNPFDDFPVRFAVRELGLCRNPTANKVLAATVPNNGASVR